MHVVLYNQTIWANLLYIMSHPLWQAHETLQSATISVHCDLGVSYHQMQSMGIQTRPGGMKSQI